MFPGGIVSGDKITAALELLKAAMGSAGPQLTVAEVIAAYVAARESRHRADGWRSLMSKLGNVQREWGSRAVMDLCVDESIAKTGVERFCAVWPDALDALRELPQTGEFMFPSPRNPRKPVSYASINRQWNWIVDVAGIAPNEDGTRAELYALRGTLATRLALEEGYEITQLMLAMGWSNPLQARAYVRTGARQVGEMAARLQAAQNARKAPKSMRPMASVASLHGDFVTDIGATKLTIRNKKP